AEGRSLVYRDNLWFDQEFLQYFLDEAQALGGACRAAFPADDRAFRTYVLPLTTDFELTRDANGRAIYLIDLWYFPNGYTADVKPVVIPSEAKEKGFYSVPDFMTMEQGDLTHFLPVRAVMAIQSWVHVYF